MRFLERIANASFKEREDGLVVFYPNGIFGSGYVVSREEASRIKRFKKRFHIVILCLLLPITLIASVLGLLLIILITPVWYIRIRQLLSNSRKLTEKRSFNEAWKEQAETLGVKECAQAFIFFLIVTILCLFSLMITWFDPIRLIGFILIGLITFHIGRMYNYADRKGK